MINELVLCAVLTYPTAERQHTAYLMDSESNANKDQGVKDLKMISVYILRREPP